MSSSEFLRQIANSSPLSSASVGIRRGVRAVLVVLASVRATYETYDEGKQT